MKWYLRNTKDKSLNLCILFRSDSNYCAIQYLKMTVSNIVFSGPTKTMYQHAKRWQSEKNCMCSLRSFQYVCSLFLLSSNDSLKAQENSGPCTHSRVEAFECKQTSLALYHAFWVLPSIPQMTYPLHFNMAMNIVNVVNSTYSRSLGLSLSVFVRRSLSIHGKNLFLNSFLSLYTSELIE